MIHSFYSKVMRFSPVLRLLTIFLVCLMTLFLCSSGSGSSAAAQTVTIRVGGDYNYPPYEYLENGQPAGLNVDIIRAVARTMGFEVEFHLAPWSEVRQALQDGDIDLIQGIAYSTERDEIYDFSVPYTTISFDIFTQKGSSIQSLDDLQGIPVIVTQGGVMQEYLQSRQITDQLILVDTPQEAILLLNNEQYSAAVLNRIQGEYFMHKLEIDTLRRVPIADTSRKYCFAVAEGNAALLADLNEGLYILHTTGELEQIQEKWFGVYQEETYWETLRPWAIGLLATALLLIGTGIWIWVLRKQINKHTVALKKSEEMYRLLVENATEGVLVSCGDKFVFANPRASEITGYPLDTLVGMQIAEVLHPEDRVFVLDRYQRRLSGQDVPANYVFRIVTRAREERWIHIRAVVINWDGQPATLDMFNDVTERRQAEEKIQLQLQHLAALRAIDMAITASIDLPLTLRVLLEQVTAQLGADAAAVSLLDKDTQELIYAAGQGFRTAAARTVRLRLGSGMAGKVADTRKLIRYDHFEDAPFELWDPQQLQAEGFVTYIGVPLIAKGFVKGVLEIFHRSEMPSDPEWNNFLEALANQAAIAIDNAALFTDLQAANADLITAYDATIAGWARALELRDGDTEGHSQRVTNLTVDLARVLGLHGEELTSIRRGALLHDIGKMGVPDSILKKEDHLTDEEWEIMRLHPVYSHQMLSDIEFLHPALAIPIAHHEWWNGKGYPRGLKGEEIPLAARIFAVVDVWDALLYDRRYRKGWTRDKVIEQIKSLSGTQFDPRIVEAFLNLVGQDIEDLVIIEPVTNSHE